MRRFWKPINNKYKENPYQTLSKIGKMIDNINLQGNVMSIHDMEVYIDDPSDNSVGIQPGTQCMNSDLENIESSKLSYNLTCDTCAKSFKLREYLRKHMKIHLAEKPYECSHCNKRFCSRSNQIDHERRHLNFRYCITYLSLFRKAQCQYCDASYYRRYQLITHLRKIHGFSYTESQVLSPIVIQFAGYKPKLVQLFHIERSLKSYIQNMEQDYQKITFQKDDTSNKKKSLKEKLNLEQQNEEVNFDQCFLHSKQETEKGHHSQNSLKSEMSQQNQHQNLQEIQIQNIANTQNNINQSFTKENTSFNKLFRLLQESLLSYPEKNI